MTTAPIAGLSQALHLGSTPASPDGYVMLLHGFLSTRLVIARHGFVRLSIALTLMRPQKQLQADNPLRFKLVFIGLILVLQAFPGLFSIGLGGSMLCALLMSAVPQPQPPHPEAHAV